MPESVLAKPDNPLSLDNQLCFPLYAASRLVTRMYHDKLAPLGITYPQYVVLMILWEHAPCSVGVVGEKAMLNSNTLTPLLKRMEQQGLLIRQRDNRDERQVNVTLTKAGLQLQTECSCIPAELMARFSDGAEEELVQLKHLLTRVLPKMQRALEAGQA
ncbi:transcriptional regulator [Spongiibacter sp. IMCC21906]|uniref:MarR family winged helix-turn-helix transcriptional regulator n=1 Tax=Spongiibacter sp. IMCC21906 TaxID=1620392 RepID=UPI00062DEB2E|nr:MarR family transcriptional regulator [Spongiibacter sp. IMCC21906]AKH69129.1 transcriptional regulator [Spongiibacter sp. IMCC21906]